MYSSIDSKKYSIYPAVTGMEVQMGFETLACNVLKTLLNEDVPVYFIDFEPYFGRPNIYHDDDFNDYHDNARRFTFLSKAALQLCHLLNFKPDVVHANDWHTAIIPAYLKRLYNDDQVLKDTASVLTIHNLAYQGLYDRYYYDFTGLGWEDFTPEKFECYNAVNLLKGGIYFADVVNTVSPGYAMETKTPLGGSGLDYYLNIKGENYTGILNGADYSIWDPEKDNLIPFNYTADHLEGKSECRKVLRNRFRLEHNAYTPVIGIISRLVEQKGFYILMECIEGIINNMDVQFVILGAGDYQLETFYGNLHQRYPGKTGSYIGYSDELAHLIVAGSDFFLMPSINEPCGLTQIYSLKYGTLPIVRATGGLNDTVENYNQDTGEGTGFKFYEASGKAIYNTVYWVLDTYYNRRPHIQSLIKRAMQQHFSWEESAGQYVNLYYRAMENRHLR